MKITELLKEGTDLLEKSHIDNAGSEALWMLENCFDLSYTDIVLNGGREADEPESRKYLELIDKRISGVPVQYILGSWEFYGREFRVGEGVLIPRPETELLVDYALEYLRDIKNPVVIDLCAGTGCIGLTLAAERKDAKVYLVEKYDEAFSYLSANSEKYTNAVPVKGDVLHSLADLGLPKADLVLSNPPYIEKGELASLQAEVLREPVTALDGGEDGLVFYRAIAEALPEICRGAAAFECGEGQAPSIEKLLGPCRFIKDFNGTDRVVVYEGENK